MEFNSTIIRIALLTYGLLLLLNLVRSRGKDILELSSHIALVLFLSLALHALENQNFRSQIDTSTAILALSSSLVSFIFGVSIGKSIGVHPKVSKPSRVKPSYPVSSGRGAQKANDRNRTRVMSSEDATPGLAATGNSSEPMFTLGSLSPPSASLLLSPSVNKDLIDTFEGYDITRSFISETVDMLLNVVGMSAKSDIYASKQWSLMPISSNNTYVWTSKDKNDGILLKGSAVTKTSPRAVATWLLEQHIGTGLEVIMTRSEVLYLNQKENVAVRRFVCRSDRVMFSSRCFVVLSACRYMADGSCVIVTRSLPSDVDKSSDGKCVRGCIFASGFVIRPVLDTRAGAFLDLNILLYSTEFLFICMFCADRKQHGVTVRDTSELW